MLMEFENYQIIFGFFVLSDINTEWHVCAIVVWWEHTAWLLLETKMVLLCQTAQVRRKVRLLKTENVHLFIEHSNAATVTLF